MKANKYLDLKNFIIDQGFEKDIEWSESLTECSDAHNFFKEAAWVIVNSGMKNQVAVKIWKRIITAMSNLQPISRVFKHAGKAAAIEYVWANRKRLLADYLLINNDIDRIEFLKTIPWIGDITKYHLAKNLGMDVCKPDRHLVRIAKKYELSPEELCKKLSIVTGDRVATVDYVLWRAANLGKI